MNIALIIILVTLVAIIAFQEYSKKNAPKKIQGCMDPEAINFNMMANENTKGACEFTIGCMNPKASNHNPNATRPCEGEGCEECIANTVLGCIEKEPGLPPPKNLDNFPDAATTHDPRLCGHEFGCTEKNAINYNGEATYNIADGNPGSCFKTEESVELTAQNMCSDNGVLNWTENVPNCKCFYSDREGEKPETTQRIEKWKNKYYLVGEHAPIDVIDDIQSMCKYWKDEDCSPDGVNPLPLSGRIIEHKNDKGEIIPHCDCDDKNTEGHPSYIKNTFSNEMEINPMTRGCSTPKTITADEHCANCQLTGEKESCLNCDAWHCEKNNTLYQDACDRVCCHEGITRIGGLLAPHEGILPNTGITRIPPYYSNTPHFLCRYGEYSSKYAINEQGNCVRTVEEQNSDNPCPYGQVFNNNGCFDENLLSAHD